MTECEKSDLIPLKSAEKGASVFVGSAIPVIAPNLFQAMNSIPLLGLSLNRHPTTDQHAPIVADLLY